MMKEFINKTKQLLVITVRYRTLVVGGLCLCEQFMVMVVLVFVHLMTNLEFGSFPLVFSETC